MPKISWFLDGPDAHRFVGFAKSKLMLFRRRAVAISQWFQIPGAEIRIARLANGIEKVWIFAANLIATRMFEIHAFAGFRPLIAISMSGRTRYGVSYDFVTDGEAGEAITLIGADTALGTFGRITYAEVDAAVSEFNANKVAALETVAQKQLVKAFFAAGRHVDGFYALQGYVFRNGSVTITPPSALSYAFDPQIDIDTLVSFDSSVAFVNSEGSDYVIGILDAPSIRDALVAKLGASATYEGATIDTEDLGKFLLFVTSVDKLFAAANGVLPAADFELFNLLDEIPDEVFTTHARGTMVRSDTGFYEPVYSTSAEENFLQSGPDTVCRVSPNKVCVTVDHYVGTQLDNSSLLGTQPIQWPAFYGPVWPDDYGIGGAAGVAHPVYEGHEFSYTGVPGAGGALEREVIEPTTLHTGSFVRRFEFVGGFLFSEFITKTGTSIETRDFAPSTEYVGGTVVGTETIEYEGDVSDYGAPAVSALTGGEPIFIFIDRNGSPFDFEAGAAKPDRVEFDMTFDFVNAHYDLGDADDRTYAAVFPAINAMYAEYVLGIEGSQYRYLRDGVVEQSAMTDTLETLVPLMKELSPAIPRPTIDIEIAANYAQGWDIIVDFTMSSLGPGGSSTFRVMSGGYVGGGFDTLKTLELLNTDGYALKIADDLVYNNFASGDLLPEIGRGMIFPV